LSATPLCSAGRAGSSQIERNVPPDVPDEQKSHIRQSYPGEKARIFKAQ
jgi:hypothetical protein